MLMVVANIGGYFDYLFYELYVIYEGLRSWTATDVTEEHLRDGN